MLFLQLPLAGPNPVSIFVQTAIFIAICFSVLAVLVSWLRYQSMTERASLGASEDLSADQAFRINVANYLGSVHRTPRPFYVAVLRLFDADQKAGQYGEEAVEDMLDWLQWNLNDGVRKNDTCLRYGDRLIGIAMEVPRGDAERVLERVVSGAVRESYKSGDGIILKLGVEAGIASYPENALDASSMIEAAERALDTPRDKAGFSFSEQEAPRDPDAETPDTQAPEESTPQQNHLLDELTGVLRPDRIGSAMTKYVARFRKEDLPVSVLYLDVDSLESYNQHYSRHAGDTILKSLGELLQRSVREADLIGRVEGEEFVICMGTNAEDAQAAAERVALSVKTAAVTHLNTALRITCCIGVANFPRHGAVAKHLYEQSELAMQSAKMKGRNVCMLFHSSMVAPRKITKPVDHF